MEALAMINQEFWKNKNVLVTGHTGFKGSWLSLWLKLLGANVSGLSLPPNSNPSLYERLELSNLLESEFFVDIRNKKLLQEKVYLLKPDIVFHLAAQPLVRKSYLDPISTWEINVMGSLNLLKNLSELEPYCAVVMVTTDKVYKNNEWVYGYKENDPLGGYDPYSSSKAACEIAIESWRSSFCQSTKDKLIKLSIASARSGNVIGGGDWAEDRIIPDVIRSIKENKKIFVRNPNSTRPWQHVLDPLSGYIKLAERIYEKKEISSKDKNLFCSAFNFGPRVESNKKVGELVDEIIKNWKGDWVHTPNNNEFHEAVNLNLQVDKAYHLLNWSSKWNFEISVKRTIDWYKDFWKNNDSAYLLCEKDILDYMKID